MNLFLDTSALVKLYHQEDGTEELDLILLKEKIKSIYLSEISKIEFNSAILKKVRTKDLSLNEAFDKIKLFEADFEKYIFIDIERKIIVQARQFIIKY